MSKRKLWQLVKDNCVEGWDDPRLPTLAALRKKGVPPSAVRLFCERIGVAKKDSWIELQWLEKAIRDDLNPQVKRVMAVLDPLKAVIENFPEGGSEISEAPYFPDNPEIMGHRPLELTREIYIERDDFRLEPPKGFFRLAPGRQARLRWSKYIHCHEAILGPGGEVRELRCTYSDEPRGGEARGNDKPAIIHWVSAQNSIAATVRLYDRLFTEPKPTGDLEKELNPDSLKVMDGARLEKSLSEFAEGERFQFERLGYFLAVKADPKPLFYRIVSLKDGRTKALAKK
jgi:glutaminyl-tRNA synthetase